MGQCQISKVTLDKKEVGMISMHVKSPKIDRVGAGDNIEVIELGNFMCPIAAMAKYRDIIKLREDPGLPVFRQQSGACFTGAQLNRMLGELTHSLAKHIPGGVVTSHSFRAGVATEMARNGYTEEELMAVGRWNSKAYLHYVSLPRAHRASFARKIALGNHN